MLKTRFLVIMALAASITASSSFGYQLLGPGARSCGSWLADRRNSAALVDEAWVLGFLSGVGYAGDGDPLHGITRYRSGLIITVKRTRSLALTMRQQRFSARIRDDRIV
jgi:hypothetical protein